MLQFTKELIKEIINHSNECYPYEACGIIAGRGSVVREIIRVRNELASSVEYVMDDTKVKRVLEGLDEKGLDFIGVYHSHPASEAYPSSVDISKAVFNEIDYIIVSLADNKRPEIKNFKIKENKVYNEDFIELPNP